MTVPQGSWCNSSTEDQQPPTSSPARQHRGSGPSGRRRGRRGGRRSRPSSGRARRGGRPCRAAWPSSSARFLICIGSSREVVQFLGGPLRERQAEGLGEGRVVAAVEDQVLGGRRVDVAERADGHVEGRVARRPAVGAEVADVQEVAGPDGAAGIAQVAPADVRVPLALEEDAIARRRCVVPVRSRSRRLRPVISGGGCRPAASRKVGREVGQARRTRRRSASP